MKLRIPLFRKSDSIHVFLLVHLIIGLYLIPWAGDFGVAAQLTRTMSKRNTVWKETSWPTERSSSFCPERKRKKKKRKKRKKNQHNHLNLRVFVRLLFIWDILPKCLFVLSLLVHLIGWLLKLFKKVDMMGRYHLFCCFI